MLNLNMQLVHLKDGVMIDYVFNNNLLYFDLNMQVKNLCQYLCSIFLYHLTLQKVFFRLKLISFTLQDL